MAPASRNNLFAAAIFILLVIVATGDESAFAVAEQTCRHLSGSYKGLCAFSPSCYFACTDESKDNVDGACRTLRCWCYTKCPSGEQTVADAATAPIQP